MTKFAEGAERVKRKISSTLRAPLIITIAVIAVIGAMYYAFYRGRVDYYTNRNLRLVSTLAAQVEGRVFTHAREFRDGALKPDPKSPKLPPDTEVKREPVETARGWAVKLHAGSAFATVRLDDVLRPIFARRVGAAFDMMLVANDKGQILYSLRTPPPASSLLTTEDDPPDDDLGLADRTVAIIRSANRARRERESHSPLVITSLGAIEERTRWREYAPLKPEKLLLGTVQLPVRLGDADYLLFAQPYPFARAAVSKDGAAKSWIVCGLVSASRFRYDVSAISVSVILVAIGIALLALCCWPFLRIALIHPGQELTIGDVALIVICTAVGACVLTLAMLDVFAYQTLARGADEQLRHFGERVVVDFGKNVERAMEVLDNAEKLAATAAAEARAQEEADAAKKKTKKTKKTSAAKAPAGDKKKKPPPPVVPVAAIEKIIEGLSNPTNVTKYPYIETIAWIDKLGSQKARFDAKTGTPPPADAGRRGTPPPSEDEQRSTTPPLIEVGPRQYFRDALIDRTWTVNGKPYVLEWVRSRATGEVRAVLAKNTGDPEYPVIAMSTELIDISYAVRPPGAELAIIDENGEVVYHSDTERIGYENFFTETDRNRELRSAVLARRESHVSASYWGEDKSMFVRPLTGSRWTLVVYRAKRLTRVLNVEAALLTLLLLLMGASPYIILYIFVLVIAPGYRAPSVWPDEARRGDYLRLCVIYLSLLLLFGLTVYLLTPWSALYAVMLIPAIAILSTYLVLHRVARPRPFAIAAALWVVVNAALFCVLLAFDVDSGGFFSGWPKTTKAALVAVAIAVAALTAVIINTSAGRHLARLALSRMPFQYSTLYRLCGVLLLVLCAALPVAAFFNISRQVQSELLVKYGQLRAAADLEQRIARLEILNMRGGNTPNVWGDIRRTAILSEMFGSTWKLEDKAFDNPPPKSPAPSWTTNLLPALYEDSTAIRPLFGAGTANKLWQWTLDDDCSDHNPPNRGRDCITLERKVRFDVAVSKKIWPSHGPPGQKYVPPPEQKIVISSLRTPVDSVVDHGVGASTAAAMLLSGVGILIVFWYAAGFIATRVLLLDVTEPVWMARLPLSPTLGDHIFLVRRDKSAAALTGGDPMGKGLPFLDISFEELHRADGWDEALEKLDSSAAGRNVRIVDFEYKINDAEVNSKKLKWLERLLSLTDRTVIVISTVTPGFVMTVPTPKDAPAGDLERWRALLDRFVTVTAEELELRHQEWTRRQDFRTFSQLKAGGPKNWLEKETAYNPFLRRLRGELDPTADRAHLIDEISERAETYYAGLWASCRQDEKLLLYQLARNGLANGRNRRTLRRLIARGLVRRNPNLELFSETFRLYVVGAAQREDLVSRARAEQGASTWDSLRVPFFIVIVSFLLLLFATQKDLLTTTTAFATALTTGLPMIMKLVGVFSEKRGGSAEQR